MPALVEEIKVTTAAEFLSLLRHESHHWSKDQVTADGWLFRGHGNADWPLLPKLFRPRVVLSDKVFSDQERFNIKSLLDNAGPLPEASRDKVERAWHIARLRVVERKLVRSFAELADELGYATITEVDSQKPLDLQDPFVRAINEHQGVQRSHLPPLAMLAQHHGVPTRLLDWTRRSVVALSFAAEDAIEGVHDRFAVWAANPKIVGFPRAIQVLQAVRAPNSYVRAQDGVFMWYPKAEADYFDSGVWPGFESIQPSDHEQTTGPVWWKITAPTAIATEVLDRLAWERITRAHLMPSLDNVARTVIRKFPGIIV